MPENSRSVNMNKSISERDLKSLRPGNEAFAVSRRRKWLERLILVLSGLLYAAAFPPLNWTFISLFALVPLFWIIKDKSGPQAWRCGFLWGYAWCATSFFWIREIEAFVPFVTALVLALFHAFWAMPVPFLFRMLLVPVDVQLKGYSEEKKYYKFKLFNELAFIFALSAWWAIMEWVRTWIFTGFPWNFLATTQWQNIAIIQICEYTGVYGVSFLLVLVNISLAMAFYGWFAAASCGHKYKRPLSLMIFLALLLIVMAYGSSQALRYQKSDGASITFTASVLQGDIPQCRKGTEEQTRYAMNKYFDLSYKAVTSKPDLVVWPETAVPLPYRANYQICTEYRARMKKIISENKIPFVVGSIDFEDIYSGADREPNFYNSVMLINSKGELADRYYKYHLVPFGEFVPLSKYFPTLVRLVGMGRDLAAGKTFNPIEVRPGVKAGFNICFEDVVPYVSRNHVLAGANFLMVVTNDAWYPKSSEPEQHLANSVFRAVENRLPMLRCGNNSCSVLIQPNGFISDAIFKTKDGKGREILDITRRGEGWANFTVTVPEKPALTFYAKHGNVFILACWLIFGFAFAAALLNWREKKLKLLELFKNPAK